MFRISMLIFVLILAPAAWGAIIVVSPDGPGTIQEAIDQAAPDDVVELLDGTFTGLGNRDLYLSGKAIVVRSQSGDPSTCVIDCEGSPSAHHRGFYIHQNETSSTVIEGITITGGYNGWGGGIYCDLARPTIRNCHFIGNTATADGGGLAIKQPSEVTDCLFALNAAYDGGGAEVANSWGDPAVFTRCTFVHNTASAYGGGFRT